jgi:hypothetical protein
MHFHLILNGHKSKREQLTIFVSKKKLKETKSNKSAGKSSINLLEYLVQEIQTNSPSLLNLNDELSHLEAASRGKL